MVWVLCAWVALVGWLIIGYTRGSLIIFIEAFTVKYNVIVGIPKSSDFRAIKSFRMLNVH